MIWTHHNQKICCYTLYQYTLPARNCKYFKRIFNKETIFKT